MKSLNERLAAEAKKHNICAEWYDKLLCTKDKTEMLDLLLNGFDFCVKTGFPSRKFFAEFDGLRQQYGIFIDETINEKNIFRSAVFGNAKGTFHYDGYSVGRIYCKDAAKFTVNCAENAIVMLDIYQDAQVTVNVKDNANVTIYRYKGENKVICNEKGINQIKIYNYTDRIY
jgi:hypothetical protein